MTHERRETLEAYGLASIGLVRGLIEIGTPQRASHKAWAAMGLGIAAYELLSKKGETLSEGFDSFVEKHPIAVPAAVGYTALHLCNKLPDNLDLFSRLTSFK